VDDKDRLPLIGGSGETGRGILGVIVFFWCDKVVCEGIRKTRKVNM